MKKDVLNAVKISGYIGGALLIAALTLTGCGSSLVTEDYAVETAASADSYSSYGFSDRAANKTSAAGLTENADYDSGDYSEDSYDGSSSSLNENVPLSEEDAEAVAADSGKMQRKLIRNADISVQTEKFDALTDNIEKRTAELGGYVENSGIYNRDYDSTDRRSGNYTVRIPSEKLDEFLDTALADGRITSKNISTEDITLRYSDLESRVKAIRAEQDRLMELIGEAKDVDAVIALETRLSEIRYELESIQSSLMLYDNQVTYSTVYIYIDEVKAVGSSAGASFGDKISSGFKNNLIKLGDFFEDALIFVIINIPAIFVSIVFAVAVILTVRAVLRKAGRKGLKKAKEKVKAEADSDAENETKNEIK